MVYKILFIHLLRFLYSSFAVANVQGARHAPHHQYQGARTCRSDVQRSSATQRSWLQTYGIVPRRRLYSCDRNKIITIFSPFSSKTNGTVHRLCYKEKIYLFSRRFSQKLEAKREIKVIRRRNFSFSPNKLKNPTHRRNENEITFLERGIFRYIRTSFYDELKRKKRKNCLESTSQELFSCTTNERAAFIDEPIKRNLYSLCVRARIGGKRRCQRNVWFIEISFKDSQIARRVDACCRQQHATRAMTSTSFNNAETRSLTQIRGGRGGI